MLIAQQVVAYFWPTLSFTAAIWKESLMWLCAIALLLIVRGGEGLPLSSVGIGTSTPPVLVDAVFFASAIGR